MYIYKGGALAFYSSKINTVDGEPQVIELLSDFWNHISWAGIAKEGGVRLKNGKKPERLIKQIIDLATKENDIVLDFNLGSGTTCAVAHKMNRQYIGIEQLDYGDNSPLIRLQNVINGDQTGVSRDKDINWASGGEFIYFELAEWNENAKNKVNQCNNLDELISLFGELYDKYFLKYNVQINNFYNKIIKDEEFKNLKLDDQKKMFLTMLDLNHLYVLKTEMEDKRYGLDPKDTKLTKSFYERG